MKKKTFTYLGTLFLLTCGISCIKESTLTATQMQPNGKPIIVDICGEEFDGATKTSVSTLSTLEESGFFLTATEGYPGEGSLFFLDAVFHKDGDTWHGNAYWPVVEPEGGVQACEGRGCGSRFGYLDQVVGDGVGRKTPQRPRRKAFTQ